ncbi:pentapeptide repeat-containing protein, partial [Streptomyces coeruleorubidus]|uniref:pentapeptide repeat-containing protein n=1 Tax=Streptomyces coeruleorubidus TaxID=116188 RepID=UPI0037997808
VLGHVYVKGVFRLVGPPGPPHPGRGPPGAPGATSADPVGCRGIHVGDHTACLAHLKEADRTAYLTALSPGTDIDHRGTPFTPELLDQLLAALRDSATGQPHIGGARFDGASFSGLARAHMNETDATDYLAALSPGISITPELFAALRDQPHFAGARFEGASFSGFVRFDGASFSSYARFDGASFSSHAWFNGASFSREALFSGASFSGDADFHKACFSSNAQFGGASFSGDARFAAASFSSHASFDGASFSGVAQFGGTSFSSHAWFDRASFSSHAWFDGASFSREARFGGASFSGDAQFDGTSFSGDAEFDKARFEVASRLGPLVCSERVVLDGAVFQQPVTAEIAARQVSCTRTRWASTATLHLRYAELDLRDAVFEYPVLVATRPAPFSLPSSSGLLPETELSGLERGARLASVGGVDAAHLALQDIDLSRCRFAGAVHLDQLKVDGWCIFATTPTGWSRRLPWRWSRRNTLTEEHHWRVRTARYPDRATARGWTAPPQDAPVLKPAAVAALYRQLRKSLEDGKNEPDAADFYYGECEMRRHDTTRPRGERTLLTAYWALSGYGLRATRALAWLGTAMAITIAVMALWGLPTDDPKPTTTGRQVPVGQKVVLTTDTPDPVNPTGPLTERVTTERLEKSLRVVINSVVFRSSGQDLTTTGIYTEMTSRLAEPVLLGLAVLAVRSRVKR